MITKYGILPLEQSENLKENRVYPVIFGKSLDDATRMANERAGSMSRYTDDIYVVELILHKVVRNRPVVEDVADKPTKAKIAQPPTEKKTSPKDTVKTAKPTPKTATPAKAKPKKGT